MSYVLRVRSGWNSHNQIVQFELYFSLYIWWARLGSHCLQECSQSTKLNLLKFGKKTKTLFFVRIIIRFVLSSLSVGITVNLLLFIEKENIFWSEQVGSSRGPGQTPHSTTTGSSEIISSPIRGPVEAHARPCQLRFRINSWCQFVKPYNPITLSPSPSPDMAEFVVIWFMPLSTLDTTDLRITSRRRILLVIPLDYIHDTTHDTRSSWWVNLRWLIYGPTRS